MDSNGMYLVEEAQFRALFRLGEGDHPDVVENVDAELHLPDGSRWSATFMTLAEIARIMDRWRETGEDFGAGYFHCVDLVIVSKGGVVSMVNAFRGIIESGGPDGVLGRLV
jgi:hypothetical protein